MWYANEEGGVHFLLSAQPMFPQATISLAIELVPMNEERGQRHFGDSRVYRERCYFPVSELFYMKSTQPHVQSRGISQQVHKHYG